MHMNKEPTPVQKLLGDFAPTLVDLTDRVLFGEVWEHTDLSKRDRSLVTVAALIALNRPDQLRFHLNYAVQNGVKKEELIAAITHLAFYAGWPNAMSAMMIAKELFS
jgi:4-carboxymuconolactone decarboxylase